MWRISPAPISSRPSPSANDVALNIASGIEISLKTLADALLRVMESDLSVEYGLERRVNAVNRRLADTNRAAETIGFRAAIGLEEGLRRLVKWWRAGAGDRKRPGQCLRPSSPSPGL